MRSILLLSLLLLASCANHPDNLLSTQPPGLDVADVALANGSPETALHIAEHALATNPRDVPALVRLGEAQTLLGQRDQAARSFNQALAIAPDNTGAALGLGRLELATNPAAAAGVLFRLTTRDPRNVAALIDLGIAKDLLGQHIEAQRAYHSALTVDPDNVGGQVNLGLSLALSGDPRQALSILRPLARSPGASPRMRQDLAVALALAGDDDEAASVLRADIPQPQVLAALSGYHLLRQAP
ncbi:tetratricopeptide repeat protein [Rhodopila sp.]|uniref:tetratricopeptide repeat protein n=1 Tax=Rhodopila sp. TaxID=2480087 RepID=UPI003D136BC3